MSQYRATGKNPDNGREVHVVYGWDVVPGFTPGHFFQVYLEPEDPDWDSNSENCIVDLGLLDGISEAELNEQKKKWSVTEAKPVDEKLWV